MGIFIFRKRKASHSNWSEHANDVIDLAARAWGFARITYGVLRNPVVQPLPFQVYAEFNYGGLIAMMQLCLDTIGGEEGERAAQYFVEGYKNDLRTQNPRFAEHWLSNAYEEPQPASPKFTEVAYVGYCTLRGIFMGTSTASDGNSLMYLCVDSSDPSDSSKFLRTLRELVAEHQARLSGELQRNL